MVALKMQIGVFSENPGAGAWLRPEKFARQPDGSTKIKFRTEPFSLTRISDYSDFTVRIKVPLAFRLPIFDSSRPQPGITMTTTANSDPALMELNFKTRNATRDVNRVHAGLRETYFTLAGLSC